MTYPIAVLSGGMDSTVALAHARALHGYVEAVSIYYGQRHEIELDYASATCATLGIAHDIVDASSLAPLLDSALTSEDITVPHGHYADESMRATVVPNRNAILLNIVAGIAASRNADMIVTGVHAGDHPIYADCRPDFIAALQATLDIALDSAVRVSAPFVHATKTDIVRLGDALNVDWTSTWSCYEGGTVHCGQCGTCVERIEAFVEAHVEDPTEYAADNA